MRDIRFYRTANLSDITSLELIRRDIDEMDGILDVIPCDVLYTHEALSQDCCQFSVFTLVRPESIVH